MSMTKVADNVNMRTAIITGANGWLGKGLVHSIVHGLDGVDQFSNKSFDKIRVLVLPDENVTALQRISENIEIIRGDVRLPGDCERLVNGAEGAVLFHTAGIIHPRTIKDFYDINLNGTLNVLNAAKNSNLKRAVIVSSNSPIGCNPVAGHLFDEESPFNPYMHYGRSKMLMEQGIIRVQEEGMLETVRIRAPWFYGPFQPERQTLFFRMIRDGKGPIVGDGKNLRSMAYIDNLAQGLLLAASKPIANGKVYWIADERPYSMKEIIDTIESVLEHDFGIKCAHKRLRLPSIASDVAFVIDKSLQGLGLYHQKMHVLSEMNKNIACSIGLAHKELGYRPTVDLKAGMRKSIGWALASYGTL
jgi:nucleoside-diphosphate-sugar epimerase